MTGSSLDLRRRGELQVLADVVAAIRAAAPDARFVLVGAMARDLMLTYAHGIEPQRATEDLDFAFAVDGWPAFAKLREALIRRGGLDEVKGAVHGLRCGGARIDVVPFGGVERPPGTIDWPPPADARMAVFGLREALDSAAQVILPGGRSLAVASLPALALLKLFAWGDRRYTQRGKDAGDLWLLLHNYLDAGNRDRLYGNEMPQLLMAPDYDDGLAGAWMLGADARHLLVAESWRNEGALARALVLLADDGPEGPLGLAGDMHMVELSADLETVVLTLKAFRAGLGGADRPAGRGST